MAYTIGTDKLIDISILSDLSIDQINREKSRAYYIPYGDKNACKEGRLSDNKCYQLLNGEWNFEYFESPYDVPDSISEITFSNSIPVPSCFECYGYGQIQYVNIDYPFPVNPPYTVNKNPIGVYNRKFFIDDLNKESYLVFEGVASAFAVYINNKFCGFSKGSHMQSEFNISDFVSVGENDITVLVFTYCDGSYLEGQDAFRYHGIFRDVYIIKRPKNHIRDFFVKSDISGKVNIDIDYDGENSEITVEVFSPFNELIYSGKKDFVIDSPKLWNAEKPYLYGILIKCGEEYIYKKIGFVSREITENGELLINGVSVKLKGMNRHDSNPESGYAVSFEDMLNDIILMKQNNINCVRSAHYPNSPKFAELCDEYGLYLIDECDIETHGMDNAWGYFSAAAGKAVADNPEWIKPCVTRLERMVERDKNSPSVLFWSLGNESQFGNIHVEMTSWLKSRDNSRPVHYAGASHWKSDGYFEGQPVAHPCIDIVSRFYPPLDALVYQAEVCEDKRPYFMAEYAHSMGLGPGDLEKYWELVYKYPRIIGGCVWEWCDHAFNISKDGNPKYIYGGDSKEFPNDGNFCVDGMNYPDRKPHTGLRSLKKALQPFRFKAVDIKKGIFEIENKLDFTDSSDFNIYWKIISGNEKLSKGELNEVISPKSDESVIIKYPEALFNSKQKNKAFIEFYADSKVKTQLCESGFNLAWAQFEIPVEIEQNESKICEIKPIVKDGKRYINITCGNAEYEFDRVYGMISQIILSGEKMLKAPLEIVTWRAVIDNDIRRKGYLYGDYVDKSFFNPIKTAFEEKETETIVTVFGSYGPPARLPIFDITVTYTISENGLSVKTKAVKRKLLPDTKLDTRAKREVESVPRFGVRFKLNKDFETLRYFGMGPYENYIDMRNHVKLGVWESSVSEEYEPYIMPQECGNHTLTEWVELTGNSEIMRVESEKPFEFSALHYSVEQLDTAKHNWELSPLDETDLIVNYRVEGVGSNSCGPQLPDEYKIKEDEIDFEFAVKFKKYS